MYSSTPPFPCARVGSPDFHISVSMCLAPPVSMCLAPQSLKRGELGAKHIGRRAASSPVECYAVYRCTPWVLRSVSVPCLLDGSTLNT